MFGWESTVLKSSSLDMCRLGFGVIVYDWELSILTRVCPWTCVGWGFRPIVYCWESPILT